MSKKKNATFGGSKRSVKAGGKAVGSEYPANRFNQPVDAGMSNGEYGDGRDKAVLSVADTTFEGGGATLRKGDYDALWDGK